MFSAILALLVLPIVDLSYLKGYQFRPISRVFFWMFVANFLVLMQLGAKHVEDPYIFLGQVSTALYFAWFLFITPAVSILENTLRDLYTNRYNSPTQNGQN